MQRIQVERFLSKRPFLRGMRSTLDIYGTEGLSRLDEIHDHWLATVSHPRPSAEETIKRIAAEVNEEYLRLHAEHSD